VVDERIPTLGRSCGAPRGGEISGNCPIMRPLDIYGPTGAKYL